MRCRKAKTSVRIGYTIGDMGMLKICLDIGSDLCCGYALVSATGRKWEMDLLGAEELKIGPVRSLFSIGECACRGEIVEDAQSIS
jgi:hypothetical protein